MPVDIGPTGISDMAFTPEQEAFLAKFAQDQLDVQDYQAKAKIRDDAKAAALKVFEAAKAQADSEFEAAISKG